MADINLRRQTIRRATFSQGWSWLLHAADQIAQRPTSYMPAVAWLVILSSLQWFIPALGAFLGGLLAPLSIAPLLYTFGHHHQTTGANGAIAHVLRREQLIPLLRLGFYLMLVVLVLSQLSGFILSRWLTPEMLQALGEQNLPVLLQMPKEDLMLILGLTAIPMAALGVLTWFSVPLVLFQQARIPHVLWDSVRACTINWRALLALSAVLIVIVLGAGLLVILISALSGAISTALGTVLNLCLLIVTSLFLQAALAGAQFLSYQQIFSSSDTPRSDDTDTTLSHDKSGYWQA